MDFRIFRTVPSRCKKITLIYLCRSPPPINYPRQSPHSNMSFIKTPLAVFNHSVFPWDCLSFCDVAPCRCCLRPPSSDRVLLCAFLFFWSRRGLVAWSRAVSSASRSLLVPMPEDWAVLLGCLTPLSWPWMGFQSFSCLLRCTPLCGLLWNRRERRSQVKNNPAWCQGLRMMGKDWICINWFAQVTGFYLSLLFFFLSRCLSVSVVQRGEDGELWV